MAKYHINPKNGKARPCSARHSCPYGSLKDDHYNTIEAARAAYEESQKASLIPSPMDHSPRDNWVEVSERQEASVYSYYRRAMAGTRRSRSTAAQRKQAARELTAKTLNIPHSQVKSIVTQLQLEAGVPSVHDDPAHQRRVKYHTEGKALLESSNKNKHGEPRCSCGSDDGVSVRPNPFEIEVNRKLKPMLSCRACYERVAEDV